MDIHALFTLLTYVGPHVLLKLGIDSTLCKIACIRNVPSVIKLYDLFQTVLHIFL